VFLLFGCGCALTNPDPAGDRRAEPSPQGEGEPPLRGLQRIGGAGQTRVRRHSANRHRHRRADANDLVQRSFGELGLDMESDQRHVISAADPAARPGATTFLSRTGRYARKRSGCDMQSESRYLRLSVWTHRLKSRLRSVWARLRPLSRSRAAMPNFDAERFEGLVLYVAWRTRTDQSFGRVKLAKVLFYSDFEAYAETGDSLTGAIYIRMPFGPFPKALDNAELRLARAQRVRLEHDTEDYEAKRIIPLGEPPDLDDMFKPSQLVAVTKWINKISRASATVASEQSHGHPKKTVL
jgi:Protein of unknown function (DUF4065)